MASFDQILKKTLDWAYGQALSGIGSGEGAVDLAEHYRQRHDSPEAAAKALIRWQSTQAGSMGFLTGLGGVLTLPVAIPSSLAMSLFIQLRLIAAIAHLGGYSPQDDKVKTLCLMCLCGNGTKEVIKRAAIEAGEKFAVKALQNLPGKLLVEINKRVGFRLLTKFGTKGVVNISKLFPLVGGVIGGATEVASARASGKAALSLFIDKDEDFEHDSVEAPKDPRGPEALSGSEAMKEVG